jgi:hypothetical protein
VNVAADVPLLDTITVETTVVLPFVFVNSVVLVVAAAARTS